MKSKKIIALALAFGMLGSNVVYAADLNLKFNGVDCTTNDYVVEEGTTYYKAESICDILGITFSRTTMTELAEDDVIFEFLGSKVVVDLGVKAVYKDGKPVQVKYLPIDKSGELLIPARFFEEVFDFTVGWDSTTNSILINTNDEFDILEDVSRQGKDLTLAKAVEKVIANSDNIEKINESIEDTQDSISTLEMIRYQGLSISDMNRLDRYRRLVEQYEIQIETVKYNLETKVKELFVNIKNAETSLATTKYSLELSKKNLDISRQKYALGMISLKDLESQETSYNKSLENIKKQEDSINDMYESLNELMGEEKNQQYHLVLEISYSPITEAFDTDSYKKETIENSLSLKSAKLDIYNNEDEVTWYFASNANVSYSSYLKKEEALEDAKKAYEDKEDDIRELIEDTYEDLLDYEKDYIEAQEDLARALDDYEILKLKYNLGQVTNLQLESEKLNVIKAQIAIQQLVYKYDLLMFKFNNANLW